MSNNFNAISELRDLAATGKLTLVEHEVLHDSYGVLEGETAYASYRDISIIQSIIRKLDKVPCVSRLSLTIETSEFCGQTYACICDGEGDDAETYASGTVDYVDGYMSAMRVAFTKISRAWYARGLM